MKAACFACVRPFIHDLTKPQTSPLSLSPSQRRAAAAAAKGSKRTGDLGSLSKSVRPLSAPVPSDFQATMAAGLTMLEGISQPLLEPPVMNGSIVCDAVQLLFGAASTVCSQSPWQQRVHWGLPLTEQK